MNPFLQVLKYFRMWVNVDLNDANLKQGLRKAQDAFDAVQSTIQAAERWFKMVDEGQYDQNWPSKAGRTRFNQR